MLIHVHVYLTTSLMYLFLSLCIFRRFSLLKSQVLDLKEEISVGSDKLLARDQYIQDLEERSLNAESELYKLRKENEHTLCILQESLNVPEGFTIQLQR